MFFEVFPYFSDEVEVAEEGGEEYGYEEDDEDEFYSGGHEGHRGILGIM